MHKKSLYPLLSVFFIALCLINCSEDNDSPIPQKTGVEIDFTTTLGGSKNESAQAVINTTDGGYAILGHAQSMDGDVTNKSNESYDYWLLKYDATNQLQWQKRMEEVMTIEELI